MSTTQLIAVLTLVGTLLIAGIQLGRAQQQLDEVTRRVQSLEQRDRYEHGTYQIPKGE